MRLFRFQPRGIRIFSRISTQKPQKLVFLEKFSRVVCFWPEQPFCSHLEERFLILLRNRVKVSTLVLDFPQRVSVKNFLDNLKNRNQPILYIDFHSTYKNIFYISDAQLTNSHPNFLLNWLEKSRLELSKIGYNFSIKESYTKSNKVSKNYFHNKYNIPSMTYEVSDTEERSKITKSSKILARNLITILLDPEN